MPSVFRRLRRYLEVNEEVLAALSEGRGVVALESNVIAYGMPYPQNIETALAMEEAVDEKGVLPPVVMAREKKPAWVTANGLVGFGRSSSGARGIRTRGKELAAAPWWPFETANLRSRSFGWCSLSTEL